jgi:hypothetical protein
LEVDLNSLSVINEVLSIEEEEKTTATLKSQLKKNNKVIVNSSKVELINAVTKARFPLSNTNKIVLEK